MIRILSLLAALLFATTSAIAQEASLVADSVTFDPASGQLRAEGNVEVQQGEQRLRASSLTYDGERDVLTVQGPLYLIGGQDVTIIASFAELSGDLREGILAQARVVFSQQLQLAANEVRRTGGRYTQFNKTVASSCQVCAEHPTPLWEIRAQQITHDAEERQLYFDNATFRVLNVPVFYWPFLRLPDPTVERASGFLLPEFASSGDIGLGFKFPYFIAINEHSDLTLSPWLTTRGSRTLEARYRRKLSFGEFEINGALTDDNLLPDSSSLRGYVFADGKFALPRDFTLTFDVELTSDEGYLLQYDYSEKDRLDSAIGVVRAKRDELIAADLVFYRSLRDGDVNSTLPTIVGDAVYKRRRANIGLTYTREDKNGFDLGLTVGRVFRDGDFGQFSSSTGLQGRSSDWLVAAQVKIGTRLDVINRALFEDNFSFARNETRLRQRGRALPERMCGGRSFSLAPVYIFD